MIDPANADPKTRALLGGVQRKFGSIPNLMRVLAGNPAALGAYLNFSGALAGGKLGAKLHEQIALIVAEVNGCDYCLAAHAQLGKRVGLGAMDILAARVGTSSDDRVTGVVAFVRKLVAGQGRLSADDVGRPRRPDSTTRRSWRSLPSSRSISSPTI
jgi:AhpD family alkylhydroperoxidase